MKSIIGKFNDGGPVFTYTILVLLLIIIVLFVRAILEKDYSTKSRSLVASIGWVALAWVILAELLASLWHLTTLLLPARLHQRTWLEG